MLALRLRCRPIRHGAANSSEDSTAVKVRPNPTMAAARLAEAKADDAYVEQHRARYEAALSRALSQAVKERAPDPIARLAQLLQEPSAPMRSPSKLVAKQVTD